jgi:hypothetical protein
MWCLSDWSVAWLSAILRLPGKLPLIPFYRLKVKTAVTDTVFSISLAMRVEWETLQPKTHLKTNRVKKQCCGSVTDPDPRMKGAQFGWPRFRTILSRIPICIAEIRVCYLSDSYPAFFLPIATTSNKNF